MQEQLCVKLVQRNVEGACFLYNRWLLILRCARKQGLFQEKIGFNDSFDVTKCLQQIEMPDLLHVCKNQTIGNSNLDPDHL